MNKEMQEIKIQSLSYEKFRKFGEFQSIVQPDGEYLGKAPSEFFRDLIQLRLGNTNILSMSSLRISKRPMIVDVLEYHNHCGEAILPLDSDIIVQLAPATPNGEIPYDKIEAFYILKGTVIVLYPGVWHHSPFVSGNDQAHIFCMLPERTYENDAIVVSIPGEKIVAII
ncbi:MAG: ureidoglycolate lyase [Ruminiclostridium sp.]